MDDRFNFDGLLKELFQRDRPSLLTKFVGGVRVKTFLNVEFPRVQERSVDLLELLEDDTILHVEIQSTHDRDMAYRMLEYYALVKRRHKRPMRQVLLYVGEGRLRMPDRIAEDGNLVVWNVVDIRSFDAGALIASGNPGDLALAVLAGGGDTRIRAILQKIGRLKGMARQRLQTQILVLAGLRGAVRQVQSEMKELRMVIDAKKNPWLMSLQREFLEEGKARGMAEGKAEGKAQGKAEALVSVLERLLVTKFGPLPKWAKDRILRAPVEQTDRWVNKVLDASALEEVIGRR